MASVQPVAAGDNVDELEPVVETPESNPVDEFGNDQLTKVLEDIVGSFRKDHRNLEATVLKQPFELEGETVTFQLVSEIQAGIFQKIRSEITLEIRRKLNNYNIQLDHEILEDASDQKRKLYTNTEKLQYLLEKEKTGTLQSLLERFQLETDF